MIYVKYDPSTFPKKLLDAAKAAQEELDKLATHAERVAYIKANDKIWRSFKEHLKPLSHGKCWYTESPEPASLFEVDHFRPKAKAKRSDEQTDEGYTWLAFSPENFRYSAVRANRCTRNEETDEVDGKGIWFPLCDGSPSASWGNRCEAREIPVILDPARQEDAELVDVGSDGRIKPSALCFGRDQERVVQSAKYLGLNLPELSAARRRVMRNVQTACEELVQLQTAALASPRAEDKLTVRRQIDLIHELTCREAPYSRAAWAVLVKHPPVLQAVSASIGA